MKVFKHFIWDITQLVNGTIPWCSASKNMPFLLQQTANNLYNFSRTRYLALLSTSLILHYLYSWVNWICPESFLWHILVSHHFPVPFLFTSDDFNPKISWKFIWSSSPLSSWHKNMQISSFPVNFLLSHLIYTKSPYICFSCCCQSRFF